MRFCNHICIHEGIYHIKKAQSFFDMAEKKNDLKRKEKTFDSIYLEDDGWVHV